MKKEKTLRHLRKSSKIGFLVELTRDEKSRIQKKAELYTKGNMSEWVRYASLNLEPRKEDLV